MAELQLLRPICFAWNINCCLPVICSCIIGLSSAPRNNPMAMPRPPPEIHHMNPNKQLFYTSTACNVSKAEIILQWHLIFPSNSAMLTFVQQEIFRSIRFILLNVFMRYLYKFWGVRIFAGIIVYCCSNWGYNHNHHQVKWYLYNHFVKTFKTTFFFSLLDDKKQWREKNERESNNTV